MWSSSRQYEHRGSVSTSEAVLDCRHQWLIVGLPYARAGAMIRLIIRPNRGFLSTAIQALTFMYVAGLNFPTYVRILLEGDSEKKSIMCYTT